MPLRKEVNFVYKKRAPVRLIAGLLLALTNYVIGWKERK